MKLSELILEGCIDSRQVIGVFLARPSRYGEDEEYGCCAMGAAFLGLVRRGLAPIYAANGELYLKREFPELNEPAEFPERDCLLKWKPYDLYNVCTLLNDDAEWTRERIAEYLQSLGY